MLLTIFHQRRKEQFSEMLIFVMVAMCLAWNSNALSCGPCSPATCPEIACQGSQIPGPCSCCMVCAKQQGEMCGGQFDLAGKCDTGLYCEVILEYGETVPQQAVGICQGTEKHLQEFTLGSGAGPELILDLASGCDATVSFSGCNLVGNLCSCDSNVKTCQDPFQFPSVMACEKSLETKDEPPKGVTDDCSTAICKIVFDIICPADSLKIEPRPPSGECCPQPATCRCDFASCPDVMCGTGYMKLTVRVATGQPGSCCHQYECSPTGVELPSVCAGVVCPDKSAGPDVCPPGAELRQGGTTKGGCCVSPSWCECVPDTCQVPDCWPAFSPKRVATATLDLGDCCDRYDCVAVESTEGCVYTDMVFTEGATWNEGMCKICTCLNGTAHCEIAQKCHAAESLKVCYTLPGPRTPGQVWEEDACTSCICQDGEVRCWTASCISNCLNPQEVPGVCCPVCQDTPSVQTTVTTPAIVCQALDCSLLCPLGLVMDSNGCRKCECYAVASCPDISSTCFKLCPWGYRTDERGCRMCKCQRHQPCPELEPCDKKCLYGYQTSRSGCMRCKCQNCPMLTSCDKQCTHALERDDRGCEICKCKGTALPTLRPVTLGTCLTFDGRIHVDSEIWHDGCRECFCHNGKEMCSLITCSVPVCDQPAIRPGDCCPSCPEGFQDSTGQFLETDHEVCQSVRGEYYIEGEMWNADSCTACVCHQTRVLCSAMECPPLPCNQPITTDGECCPHCPDNTITAGSTPSSHDDVQPPRSCHMASGVFFEPGASWKEDDCTSCTCRHGEVTCYSQTCTPVDCRVPVLKKGQCCPVCMGPAPISYCEFDSRTYSDGETWNLDRCIHCICEEGKTRCIVPDCPDTSCSNSVILPGECCPQCPNDTNKPAIPHNNEVIMTEPVVETYVTATISNHLPRKPSSDIDTKTSIDPNNKTTPLSKPFPVLPVIFSTLAVLLALCIVLIMLLYVTRWRHRLLYQVTKKGTPPPKVMTSGSSQLAATTPTPVKMMNMDIKNTNRDSVRDSIRDSVIFKDNMSPKSNLDAGIDIKRLSEYSNVKPAPV